MMSNQEHWNKVYRSKTDAEVSWTQADPAVSLSLIREACTTGSVIDVGGGTSNLADRLLEQGYSVAVLDISAAALERAKDRMGGMAGRVRWIAADVTTSPDLGTFNVWHDRAVFHFLMTPDDRKAYIDLLARTVPSGSHAIIATFALDGPEKCSGLPVQRYDGPALASEIGCGFDLIKTVHEMHLTPWGKSQSFQYSVFRRA